MPAPPSRVDDRAAVHAGGLRDAVTAFLRTDSATGHRAEGSGRHTGAGCYSASRSASTGAGLVDPAAAAIAEAAGCRDARRLRQRYGGEIRR